MASSSRAGQSRRDSSISIWISDHEGSDEETELLGLTEEEDRAMSMSDPASNSQRVPPWKNYESTVDVENITDIFHELSIFDSDDEPDLESDENNPLTWSENFDDFTGQPFPFTADTGPTFVSTDPYAIFTKIWDKHIMSLIAHETNRYARQIAELQQNQAIDTNAYTLVEWKDTTVEELYIMLVLIIFSSITKKVKLFQGNSPLPVFNEIMSMKRLRALNRCLHFVDNNNINDLPSVDKMLAKIDPIMNHCNKKFSELYRPSQFLGIDDSLLLGKGDEKRKDRKLANYFGIRTYELIDASTGYILKNLQYPGRDEKFTSRDKTHIVLDLVSGYCNKGYRVVADDYFTSVYLARMLKLRGFDSLCEVRKKSKELPEIIRQLEDAANEDQNAAGDDPMQNQVNGNRITTISRHCGDITVATNTPYDLTIYSTYHTSQMIESKGGVRGHVVTMDYFNLRDKMYEREDILSDYLKPIAGRWYIKQFKRLVNISIGNSYIIYKSNVQSDPITQISFRRKLAHRLLFRYGNKKMVAKVKSKSIYDNDDTSDDSFSMCDMFSDESLDES